MNKKNSTIILLIITGLFLSLSCAKPDTFKNKKYRSDFSSDEQKILKAARTIIDSAYYGTFISLDTYGQPKARIMEPFKPGQHFEIYLATNPRSRKVKEIKNNPVASMHYFDKLRVGYVSLYGKAYLVNDDSLKQKLWKAGWERFYKNRDDDYMLIRFEPDYLEVISIPEGLTGDDQTWMPSRVDLKK